MTPLLTLALAATAASQPIFERLPGDASGPINCPKPPATIRTVEGRIYQCSPEEGMSAYRDVTPPDDQTHWMLPFGSAVPPPYGTGSYHPLQHWPFRVIVWIGNPAAPGAELFYVFDRHGVVVDSNEPGAVGDRMMEVRVSGIPLWPTANVYYRLPPPGDKQKYKWSDPGTRIADGPFYALVVDGPMLCPLLDESLVSNWSGADESSSPAGTYINGHCGEAYRIQPSTSDDDDGNPRYYAYPGFRAGGLALRWSFQRHDEPVRPVLSRRGKCLTFCTPDASGTAD